MSTPCLFAPWSDVLPELQNEIATRHMDAFTRHYLALTCRAHCAQWHTFLKVIAQSTGPESAQLSHALGRWATYEDIQMYLNKVGWELNHQEALIHGLVREGRDALLLAFIERPQVDFSLDIEFGMAQSAFVTYRTKKAYDTFRQCILDHPSHEVVTMTLIDSEYLLHRGNIPWCIEHYTAMCGVYGAITDNNIKYMLNCLLVSRAQPWFHDGNDPLIVQWADLFQSAIGPQCLEIVQSKSIIPSFYRDDTRFAMSYTHAWIRLWPYLLLVQQEEIRQRLGITIKGLSWFLQMHTMLWIIETIGIFPYSPLDAYVFGPHYPWDNPVFHCILEHYWTAKKLVLVRDNANPDWPIRFSIRENLALATPAGREQTLTWFKEHSFPGSDFIVQCIEQINE